MAIPRKNGFVAPGLQNSTSLPLGQSTFSQPLDRFGPIDGADFGVSDRRRFIAPGDEQMSDAVMCSIEGLNIRDMVGITVKSGLLVSCLALLTLTSLTLMGCAPADS